jgi:hypothetical protein
MPSTTVATLTVCEQHRRFVSVSVTLTDRGPGNGIVELTGTGRDGQAHLTGTSADIYSFRLAARRTPR